MSEYTKKLTAEELIIYIANDYVELSTDKIRFQRDDFIKICREWLENNPEHKIYTKPFITPSYIQGCSVCGLGANSVATGYVCNHPSCPTRISC